MKKRMHSLLLGAALMIGMTSLAYAETPSLFALPPAPSVDTGNVVTVTTDGGVGEAALKLTVVNSSGTEGNLFSVTIPSQFPVNIDTTGTITVAEGARIVNNNYDKAVEVKAINLTAADGWSTAAFDADSFASMAADTKAVAVKFNGDVSDAAGDLALKTDGSWRIAANGTLSLTYDVLVPLQTTPKDSTQIGTIKFTLGWAA